MRTTERGALRGDGNGVDVLQRRPRDELDGVNGAFGGDAEPRQDPKPAGVARVLDRRDGREVDLAREQARIQLGGNAVHFLDVGLEPVKDRRHVHVGDTAEPNHAVRPSRLRAASVRRG